MYPTILSKTLLACCASTRFISISLGCFKDAFTAGFVISLNVILAVFFMSSFNAVAKCHEIASPSRSGSVARYTLSAFLTCLLNSASFPPLPLMVIYFGS